MVTTPIALDKPSIAILGAGRVGSTLARALHAAGYPIAAVWSRTLVHAQELAREVDARVTPLEATPASARITLVAVSDDSLAELAANLAHAGAWSTGQMVVHCSGVLPAAVLAPAAEHGALIGGLHPLAAIAERNQALPPGITFAVEAGEPLRDTLWRMARDLDGHPFDIDPAARPLYHAAAVLASNYTVVLAALATELLQRAGMDADQALPAIVPLMRSTLDNLAAAGLPGALTGPVVRGDAGTVMAHLAALDAEAPHIAHIYRALAHAAIPLAAGRANLSPTTLEQLETVLDARRVDQPHLAASLKAALARV
jgi:predicted short-subunit dehydrogenase-like oxidoreductase (DUF2520 family)